jgi:hypothetical protein
MALAIYLPQLMLQRAETICPCQTLARLHTENQIVGGHLSLYVWGRTAERPLSPHGNSTTRGHMHFLFVPKQRNTCSAKQFLLQENVVINYQFGMQN